MTGYETISDMHAIAHNQMDQLLDPSKGDGGAIRCERGKLVETIVRTMWENTGSDCHCTNQKYEVQNRSNTETIKMHLDVSLFRDETLVGMVECKAYLDLCYLERAAINAMYLKHTLSVPMCIVALENSVAATSEKFILDDGWIDGIFYMCEGKRSSSKPMYRAPYFKPIDESMYRRLQTWMETLYVNTR